MKKKTPLRSIFILVGILFLLVLTPRFIQASDPETAELQAVWQRVREAGAYEFTADLTQTVAPLDTVKNAGREDKVTRLYMEGNSDLAAYSLMLTVWSGGGSALALESGQQIKVENGEAFARQGNEPWESIDDFSNMFAPGGDFMTFLVAAENVTRGSWERQETPSGEVAFVRYTFDINGRLFAEFMREQLTEQLNAKGELPPGMSLDVPKAYVGMTGQGEVWVGENGLPIRQVFDIQFPETADDHSISAHVAVDFSGFPPLPAPTLTNKINRVLRPALAGMTTPEGLSPIFVLLMMIGLTFMMVRCRESRAIYAAVVLTVILSMLFTPLLMGIQVQAFSDRQISQQSQQAQQEVQAESDAQRITPQFNPHANPLARVRTEQALMAEAGTGTNPNGTNQYAFTSCSDNPQGDDDGDQLTNIEECLLGTNPSAPDTDADGANDYTEVTGIVLQDQNGHLVTWYTDPFNQDTNRDGIADGKEWHLDANADGKPDDTDGDGTPDMWDRDNDGDGVPDDLDLSPYFSTKDTRTFSDGSPFQLLVDDLTTDDIVKVEFQLSPTDANHLWYTLNVLDWPKGDQEGQIQDTDGETFYSLNSNITQTPNDDGDMRLIPMLEIEITGTPDNLPSDDVLKDFGISVHQTSSNTQTAYVPLQLVSDRIGEKNVAFYGRMFYEADSSWGNAHQVRLVWLVQALIDKCKTYKNNVCTEYSKTNDVQIIQTYDDDFFFTGLSVTEEQGAKIATIYEDPTVATDAPLYFDTLYKMFFGLDNSYLAGSDCDTTNSAGDCIGNGTLDVTIDDITTRFNHTTNSNVDVNQRWDMENVLSVTTQSYKSLDLGMITTTITTTNQVLTDNFKSYWTLANPITPTLMYAWQETYRAVNMDETITETTTLTWTGNNLKVDMAPNSVSSQTLAGVKWTPYVYNGSEWAPADIEAFWEQMKTLLAGTFADNEYPETDQAWAQLLYLSVYGASINVVQINDTPVTKEYQQTNAPLTAKLAKGGGAGIKKVVNLYFKKVDPELKGGGGGLKELLGIGSEVQSEDSPLAGINFAFKLSRYISGEEGVYGEASGVIIMVAAIAASIALAEQYIHHDTNSKWKTTAAVSVGTIIFYFSIIKPMKTAVELSQALVEIDESTSFSEALLESLTSSSKLVGASRVAGVIGLIIAIGIAVFVFAYFMASGQVTPGTIAFNELIAQTIAVIILAVMLFALSASVIGSIIVGLITLVDVIAMLLGVGWTISGEASKFLASIIYQFDLTVDVDVDSGNLEMALADEAAGFTDGNSVIYSLPITTTLKQTTPRSQDALKSNTLIYEFSQVDDSYQFNTSLYDRSDEWQITQYDTYDDPNLGPRPLYEATIVDTITDDVTLSAGVNRKTNLYLDSAYALNGLSCWLGFCSSKTVSGSSANDIGSAITLDVLPATLDEFVNVSNWSNGALLFLDADGDGLLPTIAGGLDPDDTTWDADGDNLSDAYELTLRSRSQAEGGVFLDPLNPDTDGDGIRDDEELRLGTNPGNVDSDGDGLQDPAEIAPTGGWLLPYAVDKATRVWSDPLYADADQDGMNDLFERTQDTCPDCQPWANPDNPAVFNPNVWNESPIPLFVSDNTVDGFVLPSTTFAYTTTAANNFSYASTLAGELSVSLPPELTGGPLEKPIELTQGFTDTLVSSLTPNISQSQLITVTSNYDITEFGASSWGWDPAASLKTVTGINNEILSIEMDTISGWAQGDVVATTLEKAADDSYHIGTYLLESNGDLLESHALTDAAAGVVITEPNIACNDAGVCFVSYGLNNPGDDTFQVYAARLDKSIDTPALIQIDNQDGGYEVSRVTVATDGTDFMVGWGRTAEPDLFGITLELWVRPLNSAGQFLQAAQEIPDAIHADGLADKPYEVNLEWGGSAFSGYVATWYSVINNGMWYSIVDPTGAATARSIIDYGYFNWDNWTAPKAAYDPTSQQVMVIYPTGNENSTQIPIVGSRLIATGISSRIILVSNLDASANYNADIITDEKSGGWNISIASNGGTPATTLVSVQPDGSIRDTETTAASFQATALLADVGLVCFVPESVMTLDFEEGSGSQNFVDSSGHGFHATCSGDTCPLADQTGRFGNGVKFDGQNDYLDTGASVVELGKGDFTISAWVRTVDAGTEEVAIVTKSDGDTTWESGEKSFYLDNLGKPNFVGFGNEYIRGNTAVNDGLWHHLVVVWDYNGSGNGGNGRIYIDGYYATASSNYAANYNDNGGDTLKIGRPNFAESPNYFNGWVDSLDVYNRALSAPEVRDVFESATTIFDLDEVAGSTTFVNSANNGFNATCSGGNCPDLGVPGVAYTAAQFDGTDDYLEIQPSQQVVETFVYNFESGVGTGWDKTSINTATYNNQTTKFLGTFSNEPVNLNLNNLPAHDSLTVEFDLFLPGSWDGNRTDLGMDQWLWGGENYTWITTTFSNQSDTNANYQHAPTSVDNWNGPSGLQAFRDDGSGSDCSGITQTFTADSPDLTNEPIGNDTISCLEYSPSNDNNAGVLYRDINYGGTAWLFDFGRLILPNFDNDAVSSLRVWEAIFPPKHGASYDTLSVSGYSEGTIYHFSGEWASHTADTFHFYAAGLTAPNDPEVWGLDNVVVTLLYSDESVPLADSSFTVSAWAKPDTTASAGYLVSQGSASPNNGLYLGFRNSSTFTCAFWGDDLNIGITNDTEWHLWTCTYDANTNTRTLYRDGVQIAQDTASGDYVGTGGTYVGRALDGIDYFDGAIDEVGIWKYALAAEDIRELASKVKVQDETVLSCMYVQTAETNTFDILGANLRESATALGTDSQSVNHTVTIDSDLPSAAILAPTNTYVNGADPLTISGSATDPTSYVDEVEVQLNGGGWQTTANSESWSYSWDISNQGDGTILNVNARPIDVLGHVGSMVSTSYIVDNQAPAVAIVSPSGQTRPSYDIEGRLLVALSGTVNDPVSGSQPGSGVVSVEVLLEGEEGQFGYGWQEVALNSSNWSLDYLLPANADPNGTYSVQLRGTDVVGNVSQQTSLVTAEFTVDYTPPTISLESLAPTTRLITQSLTLSGQVTDTNQIDAVEINFTPAEQIASLEGAVLHLPFDETADTQYFADQSGANHAATCNNCPNANLAGQRDKALSFDGDDIVTVDGIDLANSSFTIATWAKRASAAEDDWLISQGDLGIDEALTMGFLSDGVFTCSFLGDYLEATPPYNATEWNHWVCTYDADTRLRTIYFNGEQVAQDTADANYQGTGPLHIGSLYDGNEPFNGLMDEVIVHQRTLAGYEVANLYAYGLGTWEAASTSGPSNPTWNYTIPEGVAGLEGIYQINVRGVDTLGNTTTQDGQRVWRGEIDTRPPDVTFDGQGITVVINGQTFPNLASQWDCTATDLNIDENGFCQDYTGAGPGFQPSDMVLTTYDSIDPWYANTISDTSRLYQISASTTGGPFDSSITVITCDIYNHCTISGLTSSADGASTGSTNEWPTGSASGLSGSEPLDVRILEPYANTVLTSTSSITVSGYAYALDALRTLTVTINGQPEYIQNWATDNITGTLWHFDWTPPGQGLYQFQPFLRDWEGATPPALVPQVYLPYFVSNIQPNNNQENGTSSESAPLGGPGASSGTNAVYSGTITTVYVDTEPPLIAIGTDVLTETHQIGTNIVRLDGTVSDNILLHKVEVSVDGSPWQLASFDENGRWQVSLELTDLLNGANFHIQARAIDKAGWQANTDKTITVDIVPPEIVSITLEYENPDGQILPTEPNATLTNAHTLIMKWDPTNGDTATYFAGWSQSAVPNPDELTPYNGAGSHSQVVGEAEVWYAHLLLVDGLGNVQAQKVGPLYVDGVFTPDIIGNLAYHGWANDVCTIEGVDRRLAQTHPDVAGDAVQRFYTSWDAEAFRVSWHGANWNHEGDLFLYLDTRPGGAETLFNPYPDDQETVIYLPGNTPDPTTASSNTASKAPDSIAGGPVMGADLVIWVENGTQAAVYRWDGSAWQNEGPIDESNLYFVSKQGEVWTDLLLPFSLMNIVDPSTAALGLLAVATEEDALQIWSTMPTRNPINSPRVVNPLAAQEASNTFALVRGYFWNSLGDGVCANGRLNPDGSGPTGGSFADSDLQVTMSTDPVGTTYNFINDDMSWLWTSLFGFENVPFVPSMVFNHLDADHPPVAQGQTLTYIINYTNFGSETAEKVQIELNDQYSLKIAEQLINLGDIAPGSSGSYTFTAQIDTTGLNPEQQQWAALEAFVYDNQSPQSHSSAPLVWMWSDHKVDVAAPINVSIKVPTKIINDDPVIVRGNAYDESEISHINLELRQSGSTTLIECPNATPSNASWQCVWEPEAIVDGDIFDLRAQAVDDHGHVSNWSDYVTVVVDTTPPTVTVNPGVHGRVLGPGVHTLSGSISDNLDVSKVRICQSDEDCVNRTVVLSSFDGQFYPDGTWTYYLPSPGTPDVDGLDQYLVVYGLDSVGNISTDPITITYQLDFTVPELAVTNVVAQVTEISSIPVISGNVLDSSTFDVYLRVIPPSGLEYQAIANVVSGTWDYTPFWSLSGEYSLWVYAQDTVGNRQIIGPYQITVIP